MAVIIDEIIQISQTYFEVNYSSDLVDPTFFIYINAELVEETESDHAFLTLEQADVFQITDDVNEIPEPGHPPRVTVAWYATPDTEFYLVEEFVGAAFVQRARIKDVGKHHYTWRSRILEDETVHNIRVVPLGFNENPGTPITFDNLLMVRTPDVPSQNFSYDGGTQFLTLSP